MLYRNDDVCNGFDYNKYVAVRSVFESFGIKETYSVIPFGKNIYTPNAHLLDKDILEEIIGNELISCQADEFIKESLDRGHNIALHGWVHTLITRYREYEQRHNITLAKNFLEDKYGIKIKYFVPPFNTYDESTMIVCRELNLTILGRNQSQLERLIRDNKLITDDYCWYHAWRLNINELKQWLQHQNNQQVS